MDDEQMVNVDKGQTVAMTLTVEAFGHDDEGPWVQIRWEERDEARALRLGSSIVLNLYGEDA